MKCPSCGKENSNENIFCLSCGAALESTEGEEKGDSISVESKPEAGYEPQIQEREKKKIPMKSIALVAVAVLALVVVFILIRKGASSSEFSYKNTSIKRYYLPNEEVFGLVKNGTKSGVTIDTNYNDVGGLKSSMYGNICVFTDYSNYSLNVFANEQWKILEDVSEYLLSSDGTKIAVLDKDGELSLLDCDSWKKERIASDASGRGFAISPDGSALTYSVYDMEKEEYILYVYKDGSSERIGKLLVPFGITNSAKTIYCIHSENSGIYVVDEKGNSTKIAGNAGSGSYMFNGDYSQLIFTSDDNLYVTVNGGEKIKLSSKDTDLLLLEPNGVASRTDSAYTFRTVSYGVSSLAEKFYYTEDGNKLIYLDKNWNAVTVATNISSDDFCISRDGGTLCYIKNKHLCQVSAKTPTDSAAIAEDVVAAQLTSKGDAVYYVDDSDILWYKDGGKAPKRIADDVETSICITNDDYLLFLADYSSKSGVLYSTKNGGEKHKLSDDAYNLQVDGNAAYYMSGYNKKDYTGELYAAAKKDDFVLIATEVILS